MPVTQAAGLKVLIVGGGSIGERHLRCFQQIGCDVGLCETHEQRRAELVTQYDLSKAYSSVEAAAGQSWDGAVICTPAHLHVEHALQLAAATPALLIEKPLCTRWDDVARLRAGTQGKLVQVAYVLRAHPATARLRELLAAGEIGELHQICITAGQHFPKFRPAYRNIYYAQRETGGGAIQDAATHLFDLVQYLAGKWDWIFCDYAHRQLADVQVEDTVHLLGRMLPANRESGHGAMVSLSLNQFMAPNETNVQLNGALGSLQVRYHEHRLGVCMLGDEAWSWSEPLVYERDDLFRLQAHSFLAAAAGQQSPLCSLDEAAHTLQVNLAALDSGERRAVVELSRLRIL